MKVSRSELDGVLVIEPELFGDARGFFLESWNQHRYRQAGIVADFVQDNVSFSRRGTLRGLHFQNPTPQAKLVAVLQGEVFDVVVDLRHSSPTFGHWQGVTLSGENHRQVFVPEGFAHGFVVTGESALLQYKCSRPYSPRDEAAIRWNDPAIGIAWPVTDPILSAKDASAPLLRDLPTERLFA